MKKEKNHNEMKNENEDQLNNTENKINNEEEMNKETVEPNEIKIAELENELGDFKDRLLRKAAEFENYKRRTENDQLNLIKYGAESFIIKLLPVVDDFERTLQHIDNAKDIDPLKKGVELIYEKLMKILDEQGIKKIESVGQPFDVNFHEALMLKKDENIAPHTVIQEIEKGYMYKDRVIRHAKVIVSDEIGEEQSADSNISPNNNED
jgi:molecular chaperone GrpE